jgi:hypothetical protein
MRPASEIAGWVVNVVLAGGIAWAVVNWSKHRRAAVLVVVACGLHLLDRLGTMYSMAYVFGHQTGTPSFRAAFGRSLSILSHLRNAVSVVLLVLAALPPGNVRLGRISEAISSLRTAGLDSDKPADPQDRKP